MPALLKAMPCKSCGQPHDFYTVDDQVATDRQYTFICPATKEQSSVVPWVAPEVVSAAPPGAVQLILLKT